MSCTLVEISFDNWAQLRDLYTKHKDRASSYITIQNFIDWIKKDAKLPLKIFSPNGEWQTDGTYVAVFDGSNFCALVYCNTLNENLSGLVSALNCLERSKLYMICAFQDRVYPAIEKHFVDMGLQKEQLKANETVWFHLSKEEALKFDIEPPQGIEIKSLDESHANQVNQVWPLRSDTSLPYVELLLRLNDSSGLFEEGKLIAWCLVVPEGSLGLLQVLENYKRKGLGSLVVRYMSKLMAKKGIDVTAPVVIANYPSRVLFEQLGFKIIDKVYWARRPAIE